MSNKDKSVLFVVNEACRGGAPLILLGIIIEFKKQSNIPFKILIVEDGPLGDEFRSLGPTLTWFKEPMIDRINKNGFFKQIIRKIQQSIRTAIIFSKLRGTSVVLLNTIANGHVQKKLVLLKSKFICYVHEMETSIRVLTSAYTLDITKKHTNLFLAGSKAVKLNLMSSHGIPSDKVRVLYSSIAPVFRDKADFASFRNEFVQSHHIPGNHLIVGIASTGEWRKGFDWIFPLISVYFSLFPDSQVFFVWKGYLANGAGHYAYEYDFKKSGLSDRLVLLPHGKDNIETISTFDIHLLLSREDPYPLVVLEAASFGIPTIAFKDAGGSPEFIEEDAGITVKYADFIKVAYAINSLAENDQLRSGMGNAAREKVRLRHDRANAAREVIDIMEELMVSPV